MAAKPTTMATLLCIIAATLPSLYLADSSADQEEAALAPTVRAGYYVAAEAHLLPLAALDASLYTHLYYYALAIHPERRTLLLPSDPAQVRLFANFSREAKAKNHALRTLLSVGSAGGGAGGAVVAASGASDPAFAAMAADPASRAALIDEAVALAQENGFDGLDIEWRFPASAVEMVDFGFLVAEWRTAAPPGFLLTATVYFSNHVFDAPFAGVYYPSETIARTLDWVNVMVFGLRSSGTGASTNATAFDAPLYDRASHYSASYGIVSWLDAGVPSSKVLMGLPLYGRSWFLRNKANNGVGAPAVAAGPKQRGSNATGAMSYAEVQALTASAAGGSVMTAYDNASVSSYVSVGDVWVAFDGVAVVAEKLDFAARRGLLGYFLWPVNYDDANLTVSTRASQVWMQSKNSPELRNGTGARQTHAPALLQPDLWPPPPASPAPTSASFSWLSRKTLDVQLHLCALILVCLQLYKDS